MGMDGGYALFNVAGLVAAWTDKQSRNRLLRDFEPSDISERVMKSLEATTFQEFCAAFDSHTIVYHGAKPWTAPGVLLARVSTGDNAGFNANEMLSFLYDMGAKGLVVKLLSEETWT